MLLSLVPAILLSLEHIYLFLLCSLPASCSLVGVATAVDHMTTRKGRSLVFTEGKEDIERTAQWMCSTLKDRDISKLRRWQDQKQTPGSHWPSRIYLNNDLSGTSINFISCSGSEIGQAHALFYGNYGEHGNISVGACSDTGSNDNWHSLLPTEMSNTTNLCRSRSRISNAISCI